MQRSRSRCVPAPTASPARAVREGRTAALRLLPWVLAGAVLLDLDHVPLFLGLDVQDAREDARDFISQFGLTFPHVRDPGNDTQRAWGVTGLPETYFIAADGSVVGHVIGTVDDRQLRDGIAAARSGRPAGADQGGEQRPVK